MDLGGTGITDMSSLAGLPLKELILAGARATDLSPLRGMPLESLVLRSAPVSDLAPPRGMKLRTLILNATSVSDLSPLADCITLEEFLPPTEAGDLTPLRKLPRLKRIATRTTGLLGDVWYCDQPAEEFWKKFDTKQAALRARFKQRSAAFDPTGSRVSSRFARPVVPQKFWRSI